MTSKISRYGNNLDLPTHIYYDINIMNNDPMGVRQPIDCSFNENRSAPYLTNPKLYHLSVIRFQLDTEGNLPLFIPFAQIGQNNVNLLQYSVTLSYDFLGTTYDEQVFLIYVPHNAEPSPAPPITNQDNTSRYYWMYNYQEFVNLINTALQTAFNNLNATIVGLGGALPTALPPFIGLNQNTYYFSLYADTTYDTNSGTNISIYFNKPLGTLLSAFDRIQFSNATDGKDWQYLVYNMNYTNTVDLNLIKYYQMTQSYSTTNLFCTVKSLAFKSNQLPIVQNIISTNNGQFNTDSLDQTGGYNANLTSNITDFIVNLSTGTEYLPLIIYSPQSEYRLIDMISDVSLFSMDIRVYWVDEFGNNYPLKIYNGSCQIKIMFRLKEFNNL